MICISNQTHVFCFCNVHSKAPFKIFFLELPALILQIFLTCHSLTRFDILSIRSMQGHGSFKILDACDTHFQHWLSLYTNTFTSLTYTWSKPREFRRRWTYHPRGFCWRRCPCDNIQLSGECIRPSENQKDIEQESFWAKPKVPPLVKKFLNFMKPEGSLPSSQQPATGPYCKLNESSTHPP